MIVADLFITHSAVAARSPCGPSTSLDSVAAGRVDSRYACTITRRVPEKDKTARDPGWLLLIHQIPPKPNYLRVKIWRRLQRLGAVGIKNSVYVLPRSDQAQEDFQWIQQEIVKAGGDASICEVRFVQGLSDDEVEALFRSARADDFRGIADETRRVIAGLPDSRPLEGEQRAPAESALARLKSRLAEVAAID